MATMINPSNLKPQTLTTQPNSEVELLVSSLDATGMTFCAGAFGAPAGVFLGRPGHRRVSAFKLGF